jgi:hypothetical protein
MLPLSAKMKIEIEACPYPQKLCHNRLTTSKRHRWTKDSTPVALLELKEPQALDRCYPDTCRVVVRSVILQTDRLAEHPLLSLQPRFPVPDVQKQHRDQRRQQQNKNNIDIQVRPVVLTAQQCQEHALPRIPIKRPKSAARRSSSGMVNPRLQDCRLRWPATAELRRAAWSTRAAA